MHQGDGSGGSAAYARLQDQIAWYEGEAQHNQRWFKRLKIAQIVIAAAIPVAAAASAPGALLGAGGAVIVILEGLQQLQQYQHCWTTYRATCERLKHEQQLFAALAGPYADVAVPERALAERVEAVIAHEQAGWIDSREQAASRTAAPLSK